MKCCAILFILFTILNYNPDSMMQKNSTMQVVSTAVTYLSLNDKSDLFSEYSPTDSFCAKPATEEIILSFTKYKYVTI